MSANQVIEELKRLSPDERQEVFDWLKSESQINWRRIDELMNGAPDFSEEEILNFPRVRPPGF